MGAPLVMILQIPFSCFIQKVYILTTIFKGRNLRTEIFTIVRVSMKFVQICKTRNFISAELFKTGHQQKFMPAKF